MLNVRGRRCVVVGGGAVAVRRAASLCEAGGRVVVVAPEVDDARLPPGVEVRREAYEPGVLRGAFLVVVATDDAAVNDRVTADAREAGVLVNRADAPEAGDFVVPAHAHHGPVTLAVHTGGVSAAASAAIRRELSAALDPDWPRLLELVAPYRAKIQARYAGDAEERHARLRRLTDSGAMGILKGGGPEALLRYCEGLLERDQQP